MCAPICDSRDNLVPVLDQNNVDLRDFRRHPVKDNKGRIVSHLLDTYDVKVTVSNERFWKKDRMRELAQKTILSKFPQDLPVYTHFWYARYVSSQKRIKDGDGTGSELSEAYRLIRNKDGTFECYPVTKEQYLLEDHLDTELINQGYKKVNPIFLCGTHSKVVRSKKTEAELRQI